MVGTFDNGQGGRGGIDSPAPLTLINTLIDKNKTGTGPAGSGDGAGIFASNSNTVLINSTVSNNTTGAAPANGGGIFSAGTLGITNATIAGNVASGNGQGIWNAGSSVTLRNTIVARNGNDSNGPDVAGNQYLSSGHNLIGNADGSTGFTNLLNGDQVGSTGNPRNPLLGLLATNGGATQTMGLLPGSPAIDAADNCVLNNSCTPALGFVDH